MKAKTKYGWGATALLSAILVSAFSVYQPPVDLDAGKTAVTSSKKITSQSSTSHQQLAKNPSTIGMAALYRNQANTFSMDFSTVIHLIEENGTERVFIDANVIGEVHVDIIEEKDRILAVAKIVNEDIFVSDGDRSMMDADKSDQARRALELPFGFEYNSDGSLKNILLSQGEDTFTAGVKRALASRMQFITDRSRKTAEAQEVNETGRYIAEYTTDDFTTYKKTIQRYTELASVGGAAPTHSIEAQQFHGNYGLNQDGALEYLTATATVLARADIVKFKADSEISMQWLSKSPLILTRDLLSGHAAYAIHEMTRSAEAASAPRLAENKEISSSNFSERLADLSLDRNHDEIWELRDIFIRSIQASPENLNGIEKLFEKDLNDEQKSILLGALKDAGTSEAQAKIIEIIGNEQIDMETRKHATSHLNFIEQPTEGTLEYLENVVVNPGIDPELKATAILALGGVARAGLAAAQNASDGIAMQRFSDAVTRLEQDYASTGDEYEKKAYLMGLGNAGHETSTDMLMQLTASDDASTRALAVDSLRFHESSAVDQKVIALMSDDQDIGVQVSAARSTVYRNASPEIDSALLQTAKSASSEDVRLAALSSLDFRNEDSELVTQEIQNISQSDESQKVRDVAEQLHRGRTEQENVSSPMPENDKITLNNSEGASAPDTEFSITENPGVEAGSTHHLQVPTR